VQGPACCSPLSFRSSDFQRLTIYTYVPHKAVCCCFAGRRGGLCPSTFACAMFVVLCCVCLPHASLSPCALVLFDEATTRPPHKAAFHSTPHRRTRFLLVLSSQRGDTKAAWVRTPLVSYGGHCVSIHALSVRSPCKQRGRTLHPFPRAGAAAPGQDGQQESRQGPQRPSLTHHATHTHTHIHTHTHMHNTAFWSHKPTRTNTTMLHEDVTRLRHTSFNVRSIDNLIFYSAYTFPLLLSSVYP